MTGAFNYETFSNVNDTGCSKTSFDDSDFCDGEFGKRYTIMKKKAFINHIELLISNFNMIGRSLLESANVPDVIKLRKITYPPWISNHQLDYTTEKSHQSIYDYALNPHGFPRRLPNDCSGEQSNKLDADIVPKNQGVDLTHSTPYHSVAVAVSQMASFETDPVYENHMGPESLKELPQNDELNYYFPGEHNALCEAVLQVDYLKFTLDRAKNFDENKYVFFIDDNRIPIILPTTKFFSKYVSGKNDDNSLF